MPAILIFNSCLTNSALGQRLMPSFSNILTLTKVIYNPKSWVGNVCVGDVDLKTEYFSGCKAANDLLVSHFSTSQAAVKFDALFAHPKVDHLHPNKLYIGSSIGNNEEEDGDLDWDGAMSGGLFQYFTVPPLFLSDSSHYRGIRWNGTRIQWIPPDFTGIRP